MRVLWRMWHLSPITEACTTLLSLSCERSSTPQRSNVVRTSQNGHQSQALPKIPHLTTIPDAAFWGVKEDVSSYCSIDYTAALDFAKATFPLRSSAANPNDIFLSYPPSFDDVARKPKPSVSAI